MDRGLTASEEDLVEYVFHDIKARRAGILKALTADFEDFHQQCDPAKENLCLYGFPDEHWEVNLPADEVPPEIPEPVLGINFARDGTNKKDWLSLVAIHSDAWLNALASYFGGRFQFDRTQRKHLSVMIADLPTLCEVVSEMNLQRVSGSKHSSNKSKSNSKLRASSEHQAKKSKSKHIKEEVEDLNGNDNNDDEDKHLCASCGGNDSVGDYFWICCDACEKWYHGKCVRVTPAKAKHIKNYCCPRCSHSKRKGCL
ncbi:unnamed protein product [Musa acuminata subsp. burmannicoides]